MTSFSAFATALKPFASLAMASPASGDFSALGSPPPWVAALGSTRSISDFAVEFRPSSAHLIAKECGVIGLVRDTGGAVDEPTWFFSLGVLTFTEEADAICHEWSKGDPRYTPDEVDMKLAHIRANQKPTTCERLGEYQAAICGACPHRGRIKSPIVLGLRDEPQAPEPTGELDDDCDIGRMLTRSLPPPRRWLLADTALAGHYTLLTAPGAGGKTALLIAWAVGAALGRSDIAGVEIKRQMRVLFLCGEDTIDEIMRRVWALLIKWNIPLPSLSGLAVLTTAKLGGLVLTTMEKGRADVSVAGFRKLGQLFERYEPDLVILDPLVSFVGAGLNDNPTVSAAMGRFSSMLEARGVGAIVAHHVGKASMRNHETSTADAGLGAISLVNHARIALALNRVTAEEAPTLGVWPGEAWRHMYVTGAKINIAPELAKRHFRLDSVQLPNRDPSQGLEGDWMQAAGPWVPASPGALYPDPALKAAVSVIARGGPTGPYSPSARAGKARKVKGPIEDALRPSFPGADASVLTQLARGALSFLKAQGWITEADVPVPRAPGARGGGKTCKALVARWWLSPWASEPAPGPHIEQPTHGSGP